jgi:hypothetical protein
MKVEIAKEIQEDASLVMAVKKIDHILAEIVENVSDQVSAHWELVGELKFRTMFLMLRYEEDSAGATIELKELEDPVRFKSKLRDLWDDLLQVRTRRIIERINSLMREEIAS